MTDTLTAHGPRLAAQPLLVANKIESIDHCVMDTAIASVIIQSRLTALS